MHTSAFIWELKCLWTLSHTSYARLHDNTLGKTDSEIVERIHVNNTWSWTIQDSQFSETMLEIRSCSILNMGGICGFITTLWSLWDRVTPSTCWFHNKKLFSWSLIESLGAKVLDVPKNATIFETAWDVCNSHRATDGERSSVAIGASFKLELVVETTTIKK